ncbi:MAG: polyprenyl synthetase family protein [Armatimonadetes bacterium]|nr:polyprenyl synthetase family protein [Armatimonadota bacterium]
MVDLATIYAPVQRDLDALDGLLRAELVSDDPFIGELVAYVLSTRGKLVRPALACLSAEAIGGGATERLYIAGTVELIHIASLIHDDIIDAADTRRGTPTVNVQWGNQVAVLLGDLLFARAFDLISRVRHPEVAPAVAEAAVRMSQAEIKQIEYASEPHGEEGIYLDIIEGKTAALFAAACRAGALVAGASPPQARALAEFGLAWGMSFQITDDALDMTSRAEELGKPIGSDIQGGNVTLPVIHVLRSASDTDRAALLRLLQLPSRDGEMEEVRLLLGRYGAIDYALGVARRYADRAAAALEGLAPSSARQSLLDLTEFVIVRPK